MPNGFLIETELDDIIQSRYYKTPLGYKNVDRFANEAIELEIKKTFYFKDTKKDTIKIEQDE